MKKYFAAFFILLALCPLVHARIVKDNPEKEVINAFKNDTLIVTQDKIWIFNKNGFDRLVAQNIKSDSLINLYKLNKELSDSIITLKDSLTLHLNNVIGLQKQSYDSMMTYFDRTSVLVDRSTANTDRALTHIKSLKLTSYASGAFLGGISGGLIGGQIVSDDKFSFNWTGAIIGAGAGFLLNRFLLNLR